MFDMASSAGSSGGSDTMSKSGGGSGSVAPNGALSTQRAEMANGSAGKESLRRDEAAAEGSYSGGEVNGGSKRPVWNKPCNGMIEPVMGADPWPALSDRANGLQKSSGVSFKSFLEASIPILQETGPSVPYVHKQVTNNPHTNSIQNNVSSSYGSSPQPQSHPKFSQAPSVPSNQDTSSYHEIFDMESGQKVASESQPHGTNDRTQNSRPYKRGNGPHQHADSSGNHSYGASKDKDRPHRDWNSQRSFNGRDIHPHATGVLPRGIISPNSMPHNSAMHLAPPLSPIFSPPASYPESPFYYMPVQPESIRGMGIPNPRPAPHHRFMLHIDPEIYIKVMNQIDYYFSDDNLIEDTYLRNNMDEQGWVPIKLIAGFRQVQRLTDNIAFIKEAIHTSTVVEVKGDKVRRQNDWMKWLLPASLRVPSQSTYMDPGSFSDVASRIQKINIGGG